VNRAAFALALLAASGCSCTESEREEKVAKEAIPQRGQPDGTIRVSASDRAALGLIVVAAAEGELPDAVLRFGRVRPIVGEEALVVSPVAGRIPRAPAVTLGAHVDSGAALVEVVPVLAASERISVGVQGAELTGQLEAAQGELAKNEAALFRARELARSKIVSEARLQEAETAVATTRARLEALHRAIGAQTKGQAAPMGLRAPISGTVVTLNAQVGAVVQQGDVLVRILKPGPRWIDVSVPPGDPPGLRYEVQVGTNRLPARLVAPGAVVESDGTRHDRLQIDAEAAVALVPGQSVSVHAARNAAAGIVLPEAAIVPGVKNDRVFVETEPGTFAARTVRVAARLGGRVRLASGVRAGERVVTEGAMALDGESRRAELSREE